MFCSKCGNVLSDEAQFCANCGTAINRISEIKNTSNCSTRIQSFTGEIKKCPSCGSVLPSGVLRCPECGYEIRDSQASHAAIDFFNKIQNSYSIQQKADIIKNYPIPNTKEDITDFLNRAKAEMQCNYNPENSDDILLYNAWVTHCNNLRNRVNSFPENEKKDFTKTLEEISMIEKTSSITVDAFRIALSKCSNQKQKLELIKTYPIKPNSGNLMSLVNFIDSQVEYKFKNLLTQIIWIIAYVYTWGIAFLVRFLLAKADVIDMIDISQFNKAWLIRLKEIQNQLYVLNINSSDKDRIDLIIKSIEHRKRIYTLIPLVVVLIVIIGMLYSIGSFLTFLGDLFSLF